ncbi:MAG: hypothetical protein JJU24_04045 [Natronohydrobacter sp.]|nr:hypothetical protein [Natronohydrobacter sp.]
MKRFFILAMLAAPAQAQNFTTQAEVQPILEMTRAHWVGIGTATGRDLLYFTHLLSWRCGVVEIRYGLNGAAPETLLQMEPCHRETNQPNAIRELPFIGYALNEIAAVSVRVVFPDGAEMVQEFSRAEIRID